MELRQIPAKEAAEKADAEQAVDPDHRQSLLGILGQLDSLGAILVPALGDHIDHRPLPPAVLEELARAEWERLPGLLPPERRERPWRELQPDERQRYLKWVGDLPRELASIGYMLAWPEGEPRAAAGHH